MKTLSFDGALLQTCYKCRIEPGVHYGMNRYCFTHWGIQQILGTSDIEQLNHTLFLFFHFTGLAVDLPLKYRAMIRRQYLCISCILSTFCLIVEDNYITRILLQLNLNMWDSVLWLILSLPNLGICKCSLSAFWLYLPCGWTGTSNWGWLYFLDWCYPVQLETWHVICWNQYPALQSHTEQRIEISELYTSIQCKLFVFYREGMSTV